MLIDNESKLARTMAQTKPTRSLMAPSVLMETEKWITL